MCAKTSGERGEPQATLIRWTRTFVFRGGPELGQLGCVCPIRLKLQMKDWAICPWLDSSSARGAPKDENITFSHVGARVGISNDDFRCVWIHCTNTSKGDVGGRINDGGKDKVCGEQD